MWLSLDIGNSAIKGGVFEGAALRHTFRIVHAAAGPEALADALAGWTIHGAGIASVVPALTEPVREAVAVAVSVQASEVHAGLPLPFRMGYQTPTTLGADRIAAAAAAFPFVHHPQEGPRSVVVVDAGSAVTYEVLDQSGTYRGGAIAPGPALLRDALSRGTAKLPPVPLEWPAHAIGGSTAEALQAGIMLGFVDAVAGMLHRITETLGTPPFVVATGGWADVLARHIPQIRHTDPHLVLHGIRLLLQG